MFEHVEAIRFDRMMSTGKTKPALLACEGQEGEVEVVAKFSKGCSTGGLVREALSAMLAADIGLPVPKPYLVEISPEFIDSVSDQAMAEHLRASDQFGFGSHRLPDGYAQWIAPQGLMSPALEEQAQGILAFDCWLTNADRRTDNPNLLTNGRTFAVFDHELALMTALNLFWQPPWIAQALEGTQPPGNHVFHRHLQARAAYELRTICTGISELTNERINSYAAALPTSWVEADDSAQTASAFIMSLRDNLAPALTEFTRALS